MSWNYAELSKAAKHVGGPEEYVNVLIQSGRKEMVPVVITVGLFCTGIGVTGKSIYDYVKAHKVSDAAKVAKAKAEIINGIKDYEAQQSHSTEKEENEDDD